MSEYSNLEPPLFGGITLAAVLVFWFFMFGALGDLRSGGGFVDNPITWFIPIGAALAGLLYSIKKDERLWPAITALVLSIVALPIFGVALFMFAFSSV